MNARVIAILLLAGAASSCEKVKSLAAKVATTVKQQTSGKTATSEASDTTDPALRKLVDQTAEGAIFRKDLPFPRHLEVRTTQRAEMNGRVFQASEMGKGAVPLIATQLVMHTLAVAGDEVCMTVEKTSVTPPAADNPNPKKNDPAAKGKAKEPVEQVAPPQAPVTLVRSGHGWLSKDRSDFRSAALAQKLSPVFDQLLTENAAHPRSLWFAKHRFKAGDRLDVTADNLPMLFCGQAKGACVLKLESFEAVDGHPCGVFAISGHCHRKIPDLSGDINDEDATIESGKIWCSLLYPVILKQEMNLVQSAKSGSTGGLMTRFQGTLKVTITHTWKYKTP